MEGLRNGALTSKPIVQSRLKYQFWAFENGKTNIVCVRDISGPLPR